MQTNHVKLLMDSVKSNGYAQMNLWKIINSHQLRDLKFRSNPISSMTYLVSQLEEGPNPFMMDGLETFYMGYF